MGYEQARGDLGGVDRASGDRHRALDELKEKLVELRFFTGLSQPETAEALGISVATANRDWALAKAWLVQKMKVQKE